MWKDDVLMLLKQRDDAATGPDYFDSFNYLLARMQEIEQELGVLRGDETVDQLAQSLEREKAAQLLTDEQAARISQLEFENKSLATDLERIKVAYVKTRDHNSRLAEESKLKNDSIEGINDSVLSLQIENNLLNESMAKLKIENESLLKRWMDKVSKDAEVLNEANSVIQEASQKGN